MALHKIFEGGNNSNRVTNQMFPSGTSPAACNPAYSYADHQRERSYGVTRRIDLRARVPFGGGGKDQSLTYYFETNPVAIGDELATHLLLPNSVLFGVSLGIVSPLSGLQFDVSVKNAGTSIFNNVNASTVPTNSKGCPLAIWKPMATPVLIDEEDYLILTLDTVPATGILSGGLHLWITAHMLDLDHGNA